MSTRKKWRVRRDPEAYVKACSSKAAAYRYVRDVAEWAKSMPHINTETLTVLVDEGDGRWQTYEVLSVEEIA